jgi:hypothetical protein
VTPSTFNLTREPPYQVAVAAGYPFNPLLLPSGDVVNVGLCGLREPHFPGGDAGASSTAEYLDALGGHATDSQREPARRFEAVALIGHLEQADIVRLLLSNADTELGLFDHAGQDVGDHDRARTVGRWFHRTSFPTGYFPR